MSNRKPQNHLNHIYYLSRALDGKQPRVVNEVSLEQPQWSGGLLSFPSSGFAAAPCDYKMPALDPATTYREHHPEAEREPFIFPSIIYSEQGQHFQKPPSYCPPIMPH